MYISNNFNSTCDKGIPFTQSGFLMVFQVLFLGANFLAPEKQFKAYIIQCMYL